MVEWYEGENNERFFGEKYKSLMEERMETKGWR